MHIFLFDMIKCCHDNGIHVVGLASDMSSDNQALWSRLGVYANQFGENVLVTHPQNPDDYLVMLDDTTHALKNFTQAVLKYKVKFSK